MKKITDCGNKPEDWLDYTNYMRQHANFDNKIQAHNFLSDLYENAFRVNLIFYNLLRSCHRSTDHFVS